VAGKVTCVWKVVGSRSHEFECLAILFNKLQTTIAGIVCLQKKLVKKSLRSNFKKGKTMLSLLKVCGSFIELYCFGYSLVLLCDVKCV
jgi:hypothetical protein